MLRTPKLHFDVVRRAIPEVDMFHRMMVKEHAHLSDDELRQGVLSSAVGRLEGSPRFMAYQMLLYDRFGQNSYVVGPRVQDLFRRTDLSKITPEMVVEPQTSFYVALPDCPWRIWGGDRTRWHNVEGVYVAFVDAVDRGDLAPRDMGTVPMSELDASRDKCIQILLWGGPNERSIVPTDDALLWFGINLDQWMRKGEDIETFFRHNAVMTGGIEAEDDPLDPFSVPILPADEEGVSEQRETLVNIMRLVLNVCLYMSSDDAETETVDNKEEAANLRAQIARKKAEGKRKKLERRLQNLPRTRVVYVGPLFEQMAEKERREQLRGAGGSHESPIEHAVKPHWQHYWVGSGDDRRRILRHKGMYRRGSGKPDRTIVKIRE